MFAVVIFFFFKQKTAYEMQRGLVGSEMCIRDRYQRRVHGIIKNLNICNVAVVTSGDYERCFIYKGERYSHIINPKSKFPVKDVISVTVIAKNAFLADALSTTIFLLNKDCLLYTSDAADDTPCVDLGGRRIIKKKKKHKHKRTDEVQQQTQDKKR
eukprot:TRINITY_DN50455_c0_g1_i1.p1 TRINITY_DN50455_c0_g1~~TRINITY_DN50455_c0_g1_i1.p1  ORF type:complete len:156 (-),score=47.40 TRINITY_DN50455_c0_g1_i1:63-530(-)